MKAAEEKRSRPYGAGVRKRLRERSRERRRMCNRRSKTQIYRRGTIVCFFVRAVFSGSSATIARTRRQRTRGRFSDLRRSPDIYQSPFFDEYLTFSIFLSASERKTTIRSRLFPQVESATVRQDGDIAAPRRRSRGAPVSPQHRHQNVGK